MNALTAPQVGTALAPASASAGALLMDMAAMERLERIAELMASGKTTVPQHLRGSKGDCFAITLQSMQWGMNPFAVAQKTHLVNGTLGYEAQLVAAVINSSGLVKDRFQFEWYGPWEKVIGKFSIHKGEKGEYRKPAWTMADEEGCGVRVWATLKGEVNPRTLELLLAQARTRNSTLWADDPKQQLAYLAQKRWARLFTPDVILGVYTADELDTKPIEVHMGPAVEVVPQQLPEWPADKWAAILPKMLQGIAQGKSVDGALAWLQAKGTVTPAQEQELRTAAAQQQMAQEPAEPAVSTTPAVNADKLAQDMQAATDLDTLYEQAALMDAVTDEGARLRLNEVFDAKQAELEQQ